MVEGLTDHVLVAAMYNTAAAPRLWEDCPSPALAQAAQDAPSPGPTAEDIHEVLLMRSPPKTHFVVCPIQLVSWDTIDAPPPTTEVHILKHRDTWWTVEWGDHSKVMRATAHAPDDEVPPLSRGGTACRLAHMHCHGAGTWQRLVTWPTDPPDALKAAEGTLGIRTKQVFQLNNAVPTSKPDVPATREHPVFTPGYAPVQQP